jgi:uncharacterized RDD family membrane protein YckC
MHCQYCGSINGEDDHRCLRCGRRLTAPSNNAGAATSYIGATALAVSAPADPEPDFFPVNAQAPEQPGLFHGSQTAQAPRLPAQKIIPFEQIQRQAAGRFAASDAKSAFSALPAPTAAPPGGATAPQKPSPRAASKRQQPSADQGNLDFRPHVSQERILATGVPAQVYGDGRVAPPMRRATAGAMDVSMVLVGFGLFVAAARFGGPVLGFGSGLSFGSGKALWITLAVALGLFSLFYGLLWAMARRETAGMNWTQLHLVTFDGHPLDGRNRAIRFVAAWLSYCSGGLGLLWALADEENLAFHDHISKTYPAENGSTGSFVRQRR